MSEGLPELPEGYERVEARQFMVAGKRYLRFAEDVSGPVSPRFWEAAQFHYAMGDRERMGGLIRLYLNAGMTNSPFAGDAWPTGPNIDVFPPRAEELYREPAGNLSLGWHVQNTAASAGGEVPEQAWLTGPGNLTPEYPPEAWEESDYQFTYADGRGSEGSGWASQGSAPSGRIVNAAAYEGSEGRWTAALALRRTHIQVNGRTRYDFDISIHLDPNVPPVADANPVRRRFIR